MCAKLRNKSERRHDLAIFLPFAVCNAFAVAWRHACSALQNALFGIVVFQHTFRHAPTYVLSELVGKRQTYE